MTSNFKIWRTLPLIVLGTWFFYELYGTFHEDFFFDGLTLFVIATIGLTLFIWTIYIDVREFKESKKYTSYLPSIFGLAIILINYGLYRHQNNQMNSPSLVSGFNDGGYNGFSVDFKMDGSYVMANGSGLGQSYFYGKYSINDSIIIIDKQHIDNCIKTNRLVIRTSNSSLTAGQSGDSYITQIDNNGRELDKEFRFRVTEDNRKR